jgi:hypothetical protein
MDDGPAHSSDNVRVNVGLLDGEGTCSSRITALDLS